MGQRIWFDRRFEPGTPVTRLPELLDRLGRAPDRLDQGVTGVPLARRTRRPEGAWSIAEHAGHLVDLEPLWLGRVDDLVEGRSRLRPADLDNAATWAANHNARPIEAIVSDFRRHRAMLVARVGALRPDQLRLTALHPRLEQPMTVVDLCLFVAEHDDHHLATIAERVSRS